MPSPPEPPKAEPAIAQNVVAAAALREIGRLIAAERADEIRGKRLAGAVTALTAGGVFGSFLFFTATTGYPTPRIGQAISQLALLTIASFCTALPLALAYRLAFAFDQPLRRFARPALLIALAIVAVIAAFTFLRGPQRSCVTGDEAAQRGRYEEAVSNYSWCLALPDVPNEGRAAAHGGRALAYSALGKSVEAAADYDMLFKLKPANHEQATRYGLELLRLKRYEDALNALKAPDGNVPSDAAAYTFFLRGWSLMRLNREPEARDAFDASVKLESFSALSYFSRAIADELAGNRRLATRNLEQCATLLITTGVEPRIAPFLPQIREKLRQYGLDGKYRIPEVPKKSA